MRVASHVEEEFSIELQLVHTLVNVGHRPVSEALLRQAPEQRPVPSSAQLLDAGNVDYPVVQKPVQPRHVLHQEHAVDVNGVSRQRA